MEYADYEYYVESYLLGRQPDIPESTFRYYEKQAEKEIDRVTFDRAKRMETPKEVKDCVVRRRRTDLQGRTVRRIGRTGATCVLWKRTERQVHMTCLALSTQKKENARRLRKS